MASFNIRKNQVDRELKARFPNARYTVFTNSNSNALRFRCSEKECNGYYTVGQGNFARHLHTKKHQEIIENRLRDEKAAKDAKDAKKKALFKHYNEVLLAACSELDEEESIAVVELINADAGGIKTDKHGVDIQDPRSIKDYVELEFDLSDLSTETILALYRVMCEFVPGILEQYPKP